MNQNWDLHRFIHLCYLKYFFHSVDSIFLLCTMYYNLYEEHFSFHFTFLASPCFYSNFILWCNNCFLSFKKMWSPSRNKTKLLCFLKFCFPLALLSLPLFQLPFSPHPVSFPEVVFTQLLCNFIPAPCLLLAVFSNLSICSEVTYNDHLWYHSYLI